MPNQTLHLISYIFQLTVLYPPCENLWFPKTLMEKWQKRWLGSSVNAPAPDKASAGGLSHCSVGQPSVSIQHEAGAVIVNEEAATQCQREGPRHYRARAPHFLREACSQDRGGSQPPSGWKHEGGVSHARGDGSALLISAQRGGDEVVTKHLYATSDLFHGACPCTSSSNGPSQHLLRASFGAETGINISLLLFKTQQHSYKVWTIIPTFQMRKLRLNKLFA